MTLTLNLIWQVRSPLTKNDRLKFNTVLIIDVHARDIIDSFVRDSILDEREFEWESQLRFKFRFRFFQPPTSGTKFTASLSSWNYFFVQVLLGS